MGFLVCTQNGVRMLSADCTTPFDKLMEMIPQAVDAIAQMSRKDERKQDVPRVHAAYQDT
ncbi:MAG: GerW family sporulation protein [Clostridia bacterium]|nr:GerW family sporulation protein [Clostridia bacterium]